MRWLLGLVVLLASSVLLVLYWAVDFSGSREPNEREAPKSDVRVSTENRQMIPSTPTRGDSTSLNSMDQSSEFRKSLLANIRRRWSELGNKYSGQALLAKQAQLAEQGLALGSSGELIELFDFLTVNSANDLRGHLLKLAGERLFESGGNGAAREWLVNIEDTAIKQKLCDHAGRHMGSIENLKRFMDALQPDVPCQSAALNAFCRELAKSEPSEAVEIFFNLKPSAADFAGMEGIMAVMPPFADFPALASRLPADSHNIARRARAALLRSWAAAAPDQAAQYVLSNGTVVVPEQLGMVVAIWVEKSPDEATSWIDSLSTGNIRDEGVAAMVQFGKGRGDHIGAWQWVTKVSDFDRKVQLATEVFLEWEKSDREAAVRAWQELFPPGK